MRAQVLLSALGGVAGVFGAIGSAGAQSFTDPEYGTPSYEARGYEVEDYRRQYGSPVRPSLFAAEAPQPNRPFLVTPIGMSATIGGAVTGFTRERARSFSDVGGGWEARLVIGTRSMIAAELAYVGTAQDIEALGLDTSASLVSNGGEIVARLNLLPGMFQPYVFGGAGLTHYSVVNDDFNTSSIDQSDNVFQFPLGAGLAFRYRGLVIDGRGTYRLTADGDLFGENENGMQTWSANLSGGMEF